MVIKLLDRILGLKIRIDLRKIKHPSRTFGSMGSGPVLVLLPAHSHNCKILRILEDNLQKVLEYCNSPSPLQSPLLPGAYTG